MTETERFWAGVMPSGECLIWTGTLTEKGYGRFMVGTRRFRAHRWAYEAAKGPIPDGLQIDHLCRNRACVNVDHLEAVTLQENLRRGRPTHGEGHPDALLTDAAVVLIREMHAAGETYVAIARRFGVAGNTAGKAGRGETWKHVPLMGAGRP